MRAPTVLYSILIALQLIRAGVATFSGDWWSLPDHATITVLCCNALILHSALERVQKR